MPAESLGESPEVDAVGLLAVPELHRVAPAQERGARSRLAVEIVEATVLAAAAIAALVRVRDLQVENLVRPKVEVQKRPSDPVEASSQDLERLGHLEVGDDAHGGPDDAHGVTGGTRPRRRCFVEQAAKTRRGVVPVLVTFPSGVSAGGMRQDWERHARRTDRRTVDIRHASLDREVVCEIARLEVVEAVDENIHAVRVALDVRVVHVVDDRGDPHFGIYRGNLAFGGLRLWHCVRDVALVEQHLTLEVRELDDVPVHDDQMTDACPCQHVCSDAAQSPAAEHQDGGAEQSSLPFLPESGQEHLTVISGEVAAHHRDSITIALSIRTGSRPKERRASRSGGTAPFLACARDD